MGRFAEIVGLNVTGGVRIELEKRELVAGEWLRGVVYVHMHKPVQAEALVVVITGREKTSWRDKRGGKNHYRRHTADCFNQQITLATLPPLCEPGDYVFPFQYQLPSTLPGVTLIERSNSMERTSGLKAQLCYTLEVRLRANGFFVADLSTQARLQVVALPPESHNHGLEASLSEVNFLALFTRGSCSISAVLMRRAEPVGGLVVVNVTIHNNSKKKFESVSLQLVQTINLKRGGRKLTRTLCDRQSPGVDAGDHLTRSLKLALESSFPPTCTTANLFAITYVLRVKCRYSCCPSPWLDFPFSVLAKSPSDDSANSAYEQRYTPLAMPVK